MQAIPSKFVVRPTKLLNAVLVTGAGSANIGPSVFGTSFQASVVGTGSVSATVDIEVSNDGVYWKALGTITLNTGTTSVTDFLIPPAPVGPYAQIRGNCTAISGTGAALTLTMADYIPTTTGQA